MPTFSGHFLQVSFSGPLMFSPIPLGIFLHVTDTHICLTYNYPDDGGGMLLRNFVKHEQEYTVP